jgi:hypothetical protein
MIWCKTLYIMKNTFLKILLALIIGTSLFLTQSCQTLDLKNPQHQQIAAATVHSTSYLAFSQFLKGKSDEEGLELASRITETSQVFLAIDPKEDDVVAVLAGLILDINNNYPDELKVVANDIISVVKGYMDTEPISQHYYLVVSAANGSLLASNDYLTSSK